jgi:hypothetical protein
LGQAAEKLRIGYEFPFEWKSIGKGASRVKEKDGVEGIALKEGPIPL